MRDSSAASASEKALPFHEPTIVTILIQASFLLLLNAVDHLLNSIIYCGLVGQVLLGVFWGVPLGDWLGRDVETAVVQLGYLGLILLVYEGGLNTSLKPLVANLALSSAVAITGILLPIALSFTLGPVANATPLQCFAAGAAMAATSLGTIFTILSSAGFVHTRLGVVLTSAAMMDDVVGLVMIQVVASLGSSGGVVSGMAVGRPIGASVGLTIAVVVGGWAAKKILGSCDFGRLANEAYAKCVLQTAALLGIVVAASYAGASVLFAAFLAGAAVSWWDGGRENIKPSGEGQKKRLTGTEVYEHYYQPVVSRLLAPFFFASIGFSIPITQMFDRDVVWKGIVYSALMFLGKLFTAIWLVQFSIPGSSIINSAIDGIRLKIRYFKKLRFSTTSHPPAAEAKAVRRPKSTDEHQKATTSTKPCPSPPSATTSPRPPAPRSLYPSAILGLAMVARGEVAFLIASVAQAEGIFEPSNELYLIVMWAAMLCTIFGPVGVGTLVKRVKVLEKEKGEEAGRQAALGAWGVGT